LSVPDLLAEFANDERHHQEGRKPVRVSASRSPDGQQRGEYRQIVLQVLNAPNVLCSNTVNYGERLVILRVFHDREQRD
jgi:hypothetical protein